MRLTGTFSFGEVPGKLARESHKILQEVAAEIFDRHRLKLCANTSIFSFFDKSFFNIFIRRVESTFSWLSYDKIQGVIVNITPAGRERSNYFSGKNPREERWVRNRKTSQPDPMTFSCLIFSNINFLCILTVNIHDIQLISTNFDFRDGMEKKVKKETDSFRLQVWFSNILDYVIVTSPCDTGTIILQDSR